MQPGGVGSYVPGAVPIGALVVMVTGAAIGFLAPSLSDAPPYVTDDVERVAAAIAGNPTAWRWAEGLILAATILTALGLVPITLRFEGRSRPWAWSGLVAFTFAATFGAINRMIGIGVTTWAAQRYPDPTAIATWDAFGSLPLGNAFSYLAFLALGLYGVALLERAGTADLGWLFVGVGVVGVGLEVVGAVIPGFIFLGTAAFGAASWRLGATHRDVAPM